MWSLCVVAELVIIYTSEEDTEQEQLTGLNILPRNVPLFWVTNPLFKHVFQV